MPHGHGFLYLLDYPKSFCSNQEMKTDSLREYVSIRNSLLQEKQQIQNRLGALNEALGAIPSPSQSAIDGATTSEKEMRPRGRQGKAKRRMSPEARERIAAAARKRWAAAKRAGRSRL